MTQENKELLTKDLSCRITYGVIINVNGVIDSKLTSISWYDEASIEDSVGLYYISEVKPYLFPLSSMTEEQKMFLKQQNWCIAISTSGTVETTIEGIDWLNKNNFDYRGLIEKGLAIDATNLDIY